MKRSIALLFCLLMITMPMAGCLGGDDSSDASDEELVDWNVHFAATAADLPTCDADTNGRLYYVEEDNQFQVCKTTGWEVITIQGADGADGNDGADGISTLIMVLSSTSCVTGGNTFEIGMDNNGDGILDVSEVTITVDICNGADRNNGQDGAQGPQGPQGPAGNDGADGQDGAQGPQGPQGPVGNDGADGNNGQDGSTALIATSTETAGVNCANGGVKIEVGVDDNGNGQLDTNEIDSTQYVCDGSSSATTMLTNYSTPPSPMGCDIGGSVISHGLDNGDGGGTAVNGQLESGEVDYSTTFCTKSTSLSFNLASRHNMAVFRDVIYFHCQLSHDFGFELCKLDGTTRDLVADINPGTGWSSPYGLTVFNDALYFWANDGVSGVELWKYDGFNAPSMVADINSGAYSGAPSGWDWDAESIVYNNVLYFGANDGIHGTELWKYDGLNPPSMVADIYPGSGDSEPIDLTIYDDGFQNAIFFRANNGTNGHEICMYDLVYPPVCADINPGIGGSSPNINANYDSGLTVFGNTLYFSANDGTNGYELWQYGPSVSMTMVSDINPGSGDSMPQYLTVFDNELYFSANDGINGAELWRYDGVNPPSMAAEISPGSAWGMPKWLTVFNDEIYFQAQDLTLGTGLWKYNGINASLVESHSFARYLTVIDNELYFTWSNLYGDIGRLVKYSIQTDIIYSH